jgi:hypothetical protein
LGERTARKVKVVERRVRMKRSARGRIERRRIARVPNGGNWSDGERVLLVVVVVQGETVESTPYHPSFLFSSSYQ